MQRSFILIILLSFYSILIADDNIQLPENVVRITAENWCPYTCLDTDEKKGLIVDVVEAAFKEVGFQVRYDYQISMTRAVQNVKIGFSDALLGVDDEQYVEFMDFAHEFFVYDETAFAVKKNSGVKLKDPEDLFNYKIGVISEYIYDGDSVWEDYIEKHPNKVNISVSNGEAHLIRLLLRNRIDIAVVNPEVAKYNLRTIGHSSLIDIISKNVSFKLYVGFAILKKTNKLKNIYKKYDIEMHDFSNS